MRLRYFKICAAGLFLLSASAFAAASVQAPDNSAANKKTTSNAKPAGESQKIIKGHVAGINVEKKEIRVELKGKEYPISISGSTKIVGGNNQITLDNIKAGDLVSISYQKAPDGRRIALNIDNKTIPVSVDKKAASQEKVIAGPKKDAAAPKAEAKAEPKKDVVAAPKAEPQKNVAADPKAELKTEPKTDPAPAKQAKTAN
jgi:hypothetical protein